jgi:hypothetical protein
LARGTKKPAFAGVGKDSLIAAAVARESREASVRICTFQKPAHRLADDGTPAAVLLLIPVVVDALELLEIVFDQRIQRTGARVARLINSCRGGCHTLLNREGAGMSEKIAPQSSPAANTTPKPALLVARLLKDPSSLSEAK